MIIQVTKFIFYKNQYSIVNSKLDLSLIMKLLIENAVFEYYSG